METIEHYIIHCDNDISRYIRAICATRNIDVTIENVIRDGELLNAIYRLNTRELQKYVAVSTDSLKCWEKGQPRLVYQLGRVLIRRVKLRNLKMLGKGDPRPPSRVPTGRNLKTPAKKLSL